MYFSLPHQSNKYICEHLVYAHYYVLQCATDTKGLDNFHK